MKVLKTFRHEYKYMISYDEMLKLRSKLNDLLEIDRSYDGYMVRSLYFDSLDDIDYYDKLDGVMNRKKIRLRIYEAGDNCDYVKLELKGKYDYHQLKESLVINKKAAEEIIKGNYKILLSSENEVAKKLYLILTQNTYKPKVIIEYNRIAYKTTMGGRITFDYDIKSSYQTEEFFDENVNYVKIMDPKNVVLEVKFDRFLEPYISNVLNKYINNRESVSKYVLGRNV